MPARTQTGPRGARQYQTRSSEEELSPRREAKMLRARPPFDCRCFPASPEPVRDGSRRPDGRGHRWPSVALLPERVPDRVNGTRPFDKVICKFYKRWLCPKTLGSAVRTTNRRFGPHSEPYGQCATCWASREAFMAPDQSPEESGRRREMVGSLLTTVVRSNPN
jgi:hypothetical protein